MKFFDKFIEEVENGKAGINDGLPYGFPSMIEHLPNLQKKTSYAMGAESSVGKTTVTDFMFIYSPYKFIKSNDNINNLKLKILYFSFEVELGKKLGKFFTQYVWDKYRILVDTNYVFSRGKNRISQEIYNIAVESRDFFQELEDILVFYDGATNPVGVYKPIVEHFKKNGVMQYQDDFKNIYTPQNPKEDLSKYTSIYKPSNSNLYTFAIVDHIGRHASL